MPEGDGWLSELVGAHDVHVVADVIRRVMGADCLEAGIVAGLVESFAHAVLGMLELVRMVALAGAYELLHRAQNGSWGGWVVDQLGFRGGTGVFEQQLMAAHDEWRQCRDELLQIARHPARYLAALPATFSGPLIEQLRESQALLDARNPSVRFMAGRLLGRALGDLFQALLVVRAAVQAISSLPRLLSVTKKLEQAGGTELKLIASRRVQLNTVGNAGGARTAAPSGAKPIVKGSRVTIGPCEIVETKGSNRHRVSSEKMTCTGDPVDVATGKVYLLNVDLVLPGLLGLRWQRAWYSCSTYRGPLGHGWHHGYDALIFLEADTLRYQMADGRARLYPLLRTPGETYVDPQERITLLRTALGYAVRAHDGEVQHFETKGRTPEQLRLSMITVPSGQRLRCQYDALGQLIGIVDGADRSIEVTHNALEHRMA